MYKTKEQLNTEIKYNFEGEERMYMTNLADFELKNPKVKLFGLAKLLPNEEVKYHIHEGESETYYIISGNGIYNDNGEEVEIGPGDVTFTPSGEGHALKNTGDCVLEFIAQILLD